MFEMDTFDTWWEENYGEFSGQSPQTKRKMNMAYDVGVEHQQAKVEELQVQLKGAEERAQLTLKYKDRYRDERDELQKRVDKALKIHDEFDDEDDVRLMMYAVEQALKGEGQ